LKLNVAPDKSLADLLADKPDCIVVPMPSGSFPQQYLLEYLLNGRFDFNFFKIDPCRRDEVHLRTFKVKRLINRQTWNAHLKYGFVEITADLAKEVPMRTLKMSTHGKNPA